MYACAYVALMLMIPILQARAKDLMATVETQKTKIKSLQQALDEMTLSSHPGTLALKIGRALTLKLKNEEHYDEARALDHILLEVAPCIWTHPPFLRCC